jgi:hypothetical protein
VDIFSLPLRIAIVTAAALLLGWVFLAYFRRDRSKMAHMLDPFLGALDEPHTGRSPWGYEFAEGALDGRPARVSLIPDSLITRTLPTLWLELRWARCHDAWLCVILAANGMEYFADDVDEGSRLVSPREWPESVLVRGKGPGSAALARRLRDLDLTAYEDLKMFTLSETETKVIMRCARADVPYYRTLRSADFPEDSVKPELVSETVRVLRDIERTLDAVEDVS